MKTIINNFKLLGQLTFKEHFIYWIFPLSFTLIFLLMYCSGILWMEDFVSPSFNREYGSLENSANIPLAILVIYAVKCLLKSEIIWHKLIFGAAVLISLFMFLEEIDYGLHFYDLIYHIPGDEQAVVRNFHSRDQHMLNHLKTFIYLFIMVVFVLIPLIGEKVFPAFIKLFICSPKIILTTIALEIVSLSAFNLIYTLDNYGNHSLDNNISEFGEGIIYYILMLYMIEIFHKLKKQAT